MVKIELDFWLLLEQEIKAKYADKICVLFDSGSSYRGVYEDPEFFICENYDEVDAWITENVSRYCQRSMETIFIVWDKTIKEKNYLKKFIDKN